MTAIDVAREIEDKVNVMGNSENMANMVGFLANMHRTLLQSFVSKFIIPMVRWLAKDYEKGYYDARNEMACKVCKSMYEGLLKDYPYFKDENMNLPCI